MYVLYTTLYRGCKEKCSEIVSELKSLAKKAQTIWLRSALRTLKTAKRRTFDKLNSKTPKSKKDN